MFAKLTTYLQETKTELKHVTWPTWNQTLQLTATVIGISLAVAVFLGGLDFVFQYVLETFIL